MKEHEKSFCRARVAFEENRKKNMLELADGNSPDESASPDSKDQPTVRIHKGFLVNFFLRQKISINFWEKIDIKNRYHTLNK